MSEADAPSACANYMCHGQIVETVKAAASLGINKIRITGGEPLVRPGIVGLISDISQVEGINDIAMTTNGILLPKMAADLKNAGLKRVNISLDTLAPVKYKSITRLGSLQDALEGIRAAEECGLFPLKINTVLIGGFNDGEIIDLAELTLRKNIELRFIELMPVGEPVFPDSAYIPASVINERLPELEYIGFSGTAKLYRLPGAVGRIGLISPVSSHFCACCNRIRLTSDGKIKPCLHSAEEIDISQLHGNELVEALKNAILHKPSQHGLLSAEHHSEALRNMNSIGG